MYYEINVSQKQPDFMRGSGFMQAHLFATAPRSLQTRAEAKSVYDLFKKKFPKKDGYEISVTYYSTQGTIVTNEFDK